MLQEVYIVSFVTEMQVFQFSSSIKNFTSLVANGAGAYLRFL